ncbi:hypothetical protein CFC21_044797, partial [Triticum aestivum]
GGLRAQAVGAAPSGEGSALHGAGAGAGLRRRRRRQQETRDTAAGREQQRRRAQERAGQRIPRARPIPDGNGSGGHEQQRRRHAVPRRDRPGGARATALLLLQGGDGGGGTGPGDGEGGDRGGGAGAVGGGVPVRGADRHVVVPEAAGHQVPLRGGVRAHGAHPGRHPPGDPAAGRRRRDAGGLVRPRQLPQRDPRRAPGPPRPPLPAASLPLPIV